MLGRNQVIEAFPVGRRLAFDADKGRLWAVCPRCRRWNLTPMEERWEAIEACERAFRTLPLRTQTDEIGAAKHPEGLGLIRIGRPVPLELATWRFGEAIRQRLRRSAIYTGALAVAGGVAATVGAATGGAAGFGLLYGVQAIQATRSFWVMRKGVAVPLPHGEVVRVSPLKVDLLNPDGDGTLGLRLKVGKEEIRLFGRDATRAASRVLPAINHEGARKKTVREAVSMVTEVGGAEAFLQETWGKARPRPGSGIRWVMATDWEGGLIRSLPGATLLGFEMAVQEEQERINKATEMAELKAAWRQAEAIAQISDDLLVPTNIEDRLEALRAGEPGNPGEPGNLGGPGEPGTAKD
jgi:hypothetical protein